jgi:hypothetical protein
MVLGVGLLAAGISLGVSLLRPPLPRVHDEFSYLLAADTFAHGRLANPTHPMWVHFESFHIFHQPSYASAYPPVQGLFLALGQVLTARPIAGIWLLVGLAAASVGWMLQGWVPPRWALLGSVLAASHAGIQLVWGQNYFGGCHALLGSSLVFGALPRMWRKATVGSALAMGLGLVILANCRPYEGLMISLPVAVVLFFHFIRKLRQKRFAQVGRVVFPLAGTLTLAAFATAYYNYRVTGHPPTMPYQVAIRTYAATPVLLGGTSPPAPVYRHAVMKEFFTGWSREYFERNSTWGGWFGLRLLAAVLAIGFFLQTFLLVPLFTVGAILRQRGMWFVACAFCLGVAATLFVPWIQVHYFAPAASLLFLLVVQGFRQTWRRRWRGGQGGRWLACGLVALYLLDFGCQVAAFVLERPEGFPQRRAAIVEELRQTPGKHLVIVRYGPQHSVHEEWVYNEADIDAAKVVWAREMSPDEDRRLIAYFHDRTVWRLTADQSPPQLRPDVDHRRDWKPEN